MTDVGLLVSDRVKYAVNTETDERVAIKVLDKEKIQKQNMGAQIKKEISIMKMVRHKHVVVLKEVLASRTKVRWVSCYKCTFWLKRGLK